MSVAGFDIVQHHRERTREAERRAEHLERERSRLERLLALALRVATADGKDADPLALLSVLEELDRAVEQDAAEIDELVQLLRDTDPARIVPR